MTHPIVDNTTPLPPTEHTSRLTTSQVGCLDERVISTISSRNAYIHTAVGNIERGGVVLHVNESLLVVLADCSVVLRQSAQSQKQSSSLT